MSAPDQSSVPPKLTDSPWFWVYLFSTMGVVVLFAMDAKYQHRQTHLEDEYRYATRTVAKPPGATLSDPAQPAALAPPPPTAVRPVSAEKSPLSSGPQPLTHELLISLWPLRLIAAVAMMVSCIALEWSYLRRRKAARAAATACPSLSPSHSGRGPGGGGGWCG